MWYRIIPINYSLIKIPVGLWPVTTFTVYALLCVYITQTRKKHNYTSPAQWSGCGLMCLAQPFHLLLSAAFCDEGIFQVANHYSLLAPGSLEGRVHVCVSKRASMCDLPILMVMVMCANQVCFVLRGVCELISDSAFEPLPICQRQPFRFTV